MTTEIRRDHTRGSRFLDKPWLPWGGAPSSRDLFCWYGLWFVFAYSLAMWPLKPWLIGTNPVLLEVLTGKQSAITIAGAFARVGEAPLALAVAAGILGMMKFAWLFWLAGRLWGGNIVRLLAGGSRTDSAETGTPSPGGIRGLLTRDAPASRWVVGAAVVLAPLPLVPDALAFASAGWLGLSLPAFLLLDLAGAAAWTGLFTGLGYAIGEPAVDVAETISDHAVWISLLVVAGGLLLQPVLRRLRTTGGRS
ncbi:hypothetical protein [Streptomyces huiliensis]|uniref:hypothetical protein n=1 Tax=Streptomyces huiliensis TaxID=2876027 RepID=UPI001CBE9DF1|nr:hypothetical protein [Streptomyces huiliensis]